MDTAAELVALFEKGELTPISKVPCLKKIAPATLSRWALSGRIPCLRVGRFFYTHERFAKEALLKAVIVGDKAPTAPTDDSTSTNNPADQAARARLRSRGLPA